VAKGLHLLLDGRVLVDYGTRQVPISRAQYRANGYLPPLGKLTPETPPNGAEAANCREGHSFKGGKLVKARARPHSTTNPSAF
jgi:hypothetical protein